MLYWIMFTGLFLECLVKYALASLPTRNSTVCSYFSISFALVETIYQKLHFLMSSGARGVLGFDLDRSFSSSLETPTHLWGSFWQKKVPIFRDFSKSKGAFFTIFGCFGYFWKMDPCFCREWELCVGISCEKKRPITGTALHPVYLDMWVSREQSLKEWSIHSWNSLF